MSAQTIELRCSKNPDGKYNARTFVNGKEVRGKEFSLIRGDQFALVRIYQHLKGAYTDGTVEILGLDRNAEQQILRSAQ